MTSSQLADVDPQVFLTGLADGVNRALQPALAASVLTIERSRTLGDRLAGRPGQICGLRLVSEGETMTLGYAPGPRWTAESERVSGGVTISRRTLPLGEWLGVFAGRVAAIAADAAGDAAAASRALQVLGIRTPASGIHVNEESIETDLRGIRQQVEGRVSSAAADTVAGIADLLIDALDRVEGGGEAGIILRRTATVYLPDTLRAFAALPADWVRDHIFPDGTTPTQALMAQLTVLQSAASKMRDAAIQQDASALLVNGKFLTDRFAASSLDLS